MRRLDDIALTQNQRRALTELRDRLLAEFDVEQVVLYGSVARGTADEESDADLLVVTPRLLTRPARHKITDLAFEVNLLYGTNFSTLVVDRQSWESGLVSVLRLRDEILKEGIPL